MPVSLNLYLYFLIFLFGAVVGSFLNVVILRYNTGQSFFSGRSKCFSCGKKLRWYELVPVSSFIWQKGRCSDCGSKISFQYPLVEILTGLIFVLITNYELRIMNQGDLLLTPNSLFPIFNSIYLFAIFSLLIIIAVYDYRHQIIPDLFVWIFNGLAFLSLFSIWNLENWNLFRISDFGFRIFDWRGFLAGFILFAFFALLWGVSKGKWTGFGDAKLALGLGWFLGVEKGITAILLSYWIGAAVSIFLLWLAKRKYNMKSAIAFGPFMILGAAIVFFLGDKITNFFFSNIIF
ncbi:MAG: prepilin peptidase [Candidatus Pacebacteria bacterium]|nr:prepilin peptidase [Candidatus Paceibacterota bacterium]NUQ57151.1 prepilin peptidase [Candidatus Paceibacter sp.]